MKKIKVMLSRTIVDFDIKTQLEFSKIARKKKLHMQFKHPKTRALMKLRARNHMLADRDGFTRRLLTLKGAERNDFLYIFKQGSLIKGMGRLLGEPYLFIQHEGNRLGYVKFDDELTPHDLTTLFDKVYNERRSHG